ncbi:hypothetical protein F4X88_01080 [Candidatus Poribacteria bacterium]|nr:hypothetical protein [Candidatus Poribacteria bacterium]MYA54863.1 hypothetical protein [Candidatus Poribacteria bacterium]
MTLTVGIIGYGNLARELRQLLAPFHCKLHAYDPWLPDTHLQQQGIQPMGLEELLITPFSISAEWLQMTLKPSR